MFNALVVEREATGHVNASVRQITEADLPQGNVTVKVEYSTVNYKDGLCMSPGTNLVQQYP